MHQSSSKYLTSFTKGTNLTMFHCPLPLHKGGCLKRKIEVVNSIECMFKYIMHTLTNDAFFFNKVECFDLYRILKSDSQPP